MHNPKGAAQLTSTAKVDNTTSKRCRCCCCCPGVDPGHGPYSGPSSRRLTCNSIGGQQKGCSCNFIILGQRVVLYSHNMHTNLASNYFELRLPFPSCWLFYLLLFLFLQRKTNGHVQWISKKSVRILQFLYPMPIFIWLKGYNAFVEKYESS